MLNNCVQKNDEYLINPVFVDEKGAFHGNIWNTAMNGLHSHFFSSAALCCTLPSSYQS
jgi:hypothetical protein